MTTLTRLKRFSRIDRVFHLCLMLTFLTQAATGFSRLFITTPWGKKLSNVFGGYETAYAIHQWVGIIMIVGFVLHLFYLATKIRWQNLSESVFGPDSLVPTWQDAKHLRQRLGWLLGLEPPPQLDRWTYWEKFDYWAVFWGLPLLAVTGLMLMYPVAASRFMPGWFLNIAALLHTAEAILAVLYIFIVHFFIGHLRPTSFPMNEGMFAGSITLEEAVHERPAWVERLETKGEMEDVGPPPLWFRVLYFIFGYSALAFGLYILINGLVYSRYVRLH